MAQRASTCTFAKRRCRGSGSVPHPTMRQSDGNANRMSQKHQAAVVLAHHPAGMATCNPCPPCRHGYLQSLPQRGEWLPIFWTDEELRGFTGTELEGKAEADRCVNRENASINSVHASRNFVRCIPVQEEQHAASVANPFNSQGPRLLHAKLHCLPLQAAHAGGL